MQKISACMLFILMCSFYKSAIASEARIINKASTPTIVNGLLEEGEIPIAFEGIYYVLSPLIDLRYFLSFDPQAGRWTLLDKRNNEANRLIISKMGIQNAKLKTFLEADEKKPFIHVLSAANPSIIRIVFKASDYDMDPYILCCDQDGRVRSRTPQEGDCDLWFLQPAFDVSTVLETFDRETCLHHVAKEKICVSELDSEIIRVLLNSQYGKRSPLILVGEKQKDNDNYLYFTTPDSTYHKGILISGDCALQVSNIEGALINEGTHDQCDQNTLTKSLTNVRVVSTGKRLLIKPPMDRPFNFGKMEIGVAYSSIWSCWMRYNERRKFRTVNSILELKDKTSESRFQSDCIFEVEDTNSETAHNIIATYTNSFSPGILAYIIDRLVKNSLKNTEQTANTVIDRVHTAAKDVAADIYAATKNIEQASKNIENALGGASNALKEVAKETSGSLQEIVTMLDFTLTQLAHTFHQALSELAQTGNKISDDLTSNVGRLCAEGERLCDTLDVISLRALSMTDQLGRDVIYVADSWERGVGQASQTAESVMHKADVISQRASNDLKYAIDTLDYRMEQVCETAETVTNRVCDTVTDNVGQLCYTAESITD